MDLIIQNAHPYAIRNIFSAEFTLTNLHPNEYCQEFHNYPCAVKLDRCVESCNDSK